MRFTGAVKRSSAVSAWLDTHAGDLGTIARTWVTQMRRCGSDVRELMHDGFATACVEDAPFAYVGVFKAHVNVGFFHGASLPDPDGLLQGTGKAMRHVKLKPGHPVDVAALQALLHHAHRDITAKLQSAE